MNIFSKFWNNFKLQPDIWFFYGFLATFTFSIRKVLFFYPVAGEFNEWTGAYLYLSDIFLALALISWVIIILENKNVNLSIDNFKLRLKKASVNLPLILVTWSFASILWSENQNIALFRAIKLLEFYFLYLFVIFRIVLHPPRVDIASSQVEVGGTILRNTFRIVIALGFIQAIIGIWQFIIQHSIGLFWLKESLISPSIPGVAKIIIDGEKYMRSYGLFPHPNILGGFLVISIILTLAYVKMFHPIKFFNVPRLPRENKMFHMKHFVFLRGGTILNLIILIQLITFILTFSKSAILGLFIVLGYLWYKFSKNKEVVFHVKQLAILFGIILLIAGFCLYLANLNLEIFLFKGLDERIGQANVPHGTNLPQWIVGNGAGQSVVELAKQTSGRLEAWQYQPIHNVFWLVQAELGFVGLFVFVLFLWKLLSFKSPSPLQGEGRNEAFEGILLGLIFIMLFDHYLWDIQQGQIMLWLILGLLAGHAIKEKKILSNQ